MNEYIINKYGDIYKNHDELLHNWITEEDSVDSKKKSKNTKTKIDK